MTAAETLRKARALIEDPLHWIKGKFKKDGCYCMIGALREVADHWTEEYKGARRCFKIAHVTLFNDADETTHADVLRAFDDAIALAEAEEVGK